MMSIRNCRTAVIAAALLVVLSQSSAWAAASGADVASDDDTFIRSDSLGAPGGTSPNTPKEQRMVVGNWGGAYEARALIHFDLTQYTGLATGSTITNATLKLSYFNNSASAGDVAGKLRVYRVTNSWQGGDPTNITANVGASWDQRYLSTPKWSVNGADFTGTGILPSVATAPATNAVVEWNITSIVDAWVNGGQPNYGIIVASDLDSAVTDWYLINEGGDYGTGPAAAQYPLINVTYTSVTSTTITASRDAGIRSSVNNIGADAEMRLVGATERILLRFPITTIPNNTQTAILRIKSASGGQAGTDVATAYKMTQPAWTEGTGTRSVQTNDGVTYATYDGTNAWTTAGGDYDATRAFNSPSTTISGSNVDVTFDIDITALVAEAQAAAATFVDVIVLPGAACDWRLATKEYVGATPAAPRPAQLIVASTTSPLPGITVPTPATTSESASQTINWTYTGPMTTFDVYLGDGTTEKKITATPVAGSAGTGTFTWTVNTSTLTAPPASTYTIRVVEPTKLFSKTSAAFTINGAAAPLSITTASLPAGTQSVAYTTTTLTGTGGTTPYTWTATGLPTGLTLTTGGVLSGTPSVNGTFPVTITLTDSTPTSVNVTRNIVLAAAPGALAITSSTPPNPVVNVPYSFTATATGGTAPYTWSATGLPAGITISASTGVISGTATALGGGTWTITVTDSVPTSIATPGYTVTVVTAAPAASGKKGGCDLAGRSADWQMYLLMLAMTGLVAGLIRIRRTATC